MDRSIDDEVEETPQTNPLRFLESTSVGLGIEHHGLRARFLATSRTVVMYLYGEDGIRSSARLLHQVDNAHEAAAMYFAKAVADAANSGLDLSQMRLMLERMEEMEHLDDIYPVTSLVPVGIHTNSSRQVVYVFSDRLNRQVLHVLPDHYVSQVEVANFDGWEEWLDQHG